MQNKKATDMNLNHLSGGLRNLVSPRNISSS